MASRDDNQLDYGSAPAQSPQDKAAMREVVWGLRAMGLIMLGGAHLMFAMRVAGQGCPPPNRAMAMVAVPLSFIPDPLQGCSSLWQRLGAVSAYVPWVVNSLVVGVCLTAVAECAVRVIRRMR